MNKATLFDTEHFGSQITHQLGYIADNGRIMSFAPVRVGAYIRPLGHRSLTEPNYSPVASVGYVQDRE